MIGEVTIDNVDDLDSDFMTATADVPETLGGNVAAVPGDVAVQPQSAGLEVTPEMVAQLVAWPFDMIAMRIGEGGEFWQLKPFEQSALGKAWQPIVQKLLEKMGASGYGALVMAGMMTGAALTPRLLREKSRRLESLRASTETEKSGDLPSSLDQPDRGSPWKQTGS